jgi:hypothetical protein
MKKLMFRFLMIALCAITGVLGFVACNADDNSEFGGAVNMRAAQAVDTVVVSGVIDTATVWSCDTVYQLEGKVYVSNGATLTIQAGTRIEGLPSTTPEGASALVITRGSKIYAVGEVDGECKPIVFTAANGQKGGWGGLVLLGNAQINQPANQEIEGIDPDSVPAGVDVTYGTNVPDFNCESSGTLSYVRVEFAGAKISDGNELNSFTFGGVGGGTQLDHLQAYYGADDAFEFFGGTVNGKYLISTSTDDDAFDFDFGYRGHLQFLLAVIDTCASFSNDANGIECDNNAGGDPVAPFTRPVISNLTIVGSPTGNASAESTGTVLYGARFRRATRFVLRNSVVYGYNTVVRLDGAAVTNWLGTNPYVCEDDSSYLADNVIGLINGSTIAYDPSTAVTVNSNSVDYANIKLRFPFAYDYFFSTDIYDGYALRPVANPAYSGAEFDGLNCGDACGWLFDTTPTYKGAIAPSGDYWITACWVNTEFPIYCE